MTKIELVCSDGLVLVFENGEPIGNFYCEYSISKELQNYLDRLIPRFPEQEEGDETDER